MDNPVALESYVASGQDVDAFFNGDSLLRYIAGSGNDRGVELLLAAGAHPNQVNRLNSTALHAAVYSGSLSVVRSLIEHGADISIQNKDGETPYQCLLKRMSIHKNHPIQGPRLQAMKDYFDAFDLPVAQASIARVPVVDVAISTENNQNA